mgnify:CR=1 FL=1
MKIALIGATGFVGGAILKELLDRNHKITAIVRNPGKLKTTHANLSVVEGDVYDTETLAQTLKGADAVVSAFNAGWTNPNLYADFLKGSQSVQEAVKQAGVKRLFVVGGGGSLFLENGQQIVDTESFPKDWKEGATAARDYLAILQKETSLDWTFLSPALEMHQGTSGIRKNEYRTGKDNPVFDEQGRSVISVEDTAVAIADELEQPQFIRSRFTVAY